MLPRTPSPQARGARPWPALALAVAALGLGVGQARADVIDFDPRADQVPDILSPDDLGRYTALISGAAGATAGVIDNPRGGTYSLMLHNTIPYDVIVEEWRIP